MIAPGVGDCSVTKGQHRKAVVLGGLWSYGTAIAGTGICTQDGVSECNGDSYANWESTMSDVGEQYAVVVVLASGTHSREAACFAR